MPKKFSYVAMDSRGKETKGTLDVNSQNEAISRLKEMGYFPTKVVEADKTREKADKKPGPGVKAGAKRKSAGLSLNIRIPGLGGKVKTKILTAFTRQLATLVDAGLPLLRGLCLPRAGGHDGPRGAPARTDQAARGGLWAQGPRGRARRAASRLDFGLDARRGLQ